MLREAVHNNTPVVMSNKISTDSRGQVLFSKRKTIRKIKFGPDIESLQQKINILKTMHKVQEKTRKKLGKDMKRTYKELQIVSRHLFRHKNRAEMRQSPPMRFRQGSSQIGPPRSPKKCFYCFELDHLFLFCPLLHLI